MRDEYRVCEDFRSKKFWRAAFAEGIGVALVVFVGCGSMLVGNYDSHPHYEPMDEPQKAKLFMSGKVLRVSFAFAFAVATATWNLFHISGAHFNPAITIGMLAAGRISLVRSAVYVVAQCAGSLIGALILKICIPDEYRGQMGATILAADVDAGRGALIELVVTFIVVFTYFASIDKFRTDLNGSAPLSIGLAVLACHLIAFPLTTCSLNPARSLGPATFGYVWENHWVYWVGPLIGCLCAGLLYKLVFAADPIRRDYTTTTDCPMIITTAPDDFPRQDPFASPTTNVAIVPTEPPGPFSSEEKEGLLTSAQQSDVDDCGLRTFHIVVNEQQQEATTTPAAVAEVMTTVRPETPPPPVEPNNNNGQQQRSDSPIQLTPVGHSEDGGQQNLLSTAAEDVNGVNETLFTTTENSSSSPSGSKLLSEINTAGSHCPLFGSPGQSGVNGILELSSEID